ncbi:hypothetical protein SEA_HUBBS_10 [Microbacterium phage Hubbs]|nr:hypothetical protein SEA_HUBBS_10 [Microbacterium phage Hubbs]
MTVPMYIVEERGGSNPAILQQNSNGTYTVLTHGAGEKSIDDLIRLVGFANSYLEEEDEA